MQNTTFLVAFKADFCSKNENSPLPQWDWRADDVKHLLLFGLEKWSFFFWTAPKVGQENWLNFGEDVFFLEISWFWQKNRLNLIQDWWKFGWSLPNQTPPQSDSRLMKIWIKYVYSCFQLPKKPLPLCEFLATRLMITKRFYSAILHSKPKISHRTGTRNKHFCTVL